MKWIVFCAEILCWSCFASSGVLLSTGCGEDGSFSLLLRWEGAPPSLSHRVQVTVYRGDSEEIVSIDGGIWADGRMTAAPNFGGLGYDTRYGVRVELFPCTDCSAETPESERPDYDSPRIAFEIGRGMDLKLRVPLHRAPFGGDVPNELAQESVAANPGVAVQSPVPEQVAHRCVALLLGAGTAALPDSVEISSLPFDDAAATPGSSSRRCRLPGADPNAETEGAVDCGIELRDSDVPDITEWRVPGWSLCVGEGTCDRSADAGRAGCPGAVGSGVYVRYSRGKLVSREYEAPVTLDLRPPEGSLEVTPRQAGPSDNVCVTLEASEDLADCGTPSAFRRPGGANAEWQSTALELTRIPGIGARVCRFCATGDVFTEGEFIFEARVQDRVGNAGCLGKASCDEACPDGVCAPTADQSADVRIDTRPPELLNRDEINRAWRADTLHLDETFGFRLAFDEAVVLLVVSVDGKPVCGTTEVEPRSEFTCTVQATTDPLLGDGNHSVVARATDAVGNFVSYNLGVLDYDVEAPGVTTILGRIPAFSRSTGDVVWFNAEHPFDRRPVSADLSLFTNKQTVAPSLELFATSGEACLDELVGALPPPDPNRAAKFTFSDQLSVWLLDQIELAQQVADDAREGNAPDEAVYCLRARFHDEHQNVAVDLKPRLGIAWGTPENGLDLGKTTFHRAPWGSTAGGDAVDFSVLAFTPSEDTQEPPSVARLPITDVVLSSNAAGEALIGAREESAGFTPSQLAQGVRLHLPESLSPSLAEIYAASVDAAGRVSDFGLITRGEWVATLRRGAPFGNPHHAYAWGVAHAMLQPPYRGVSIDEELARSGSDRLEAKTQAKVVWRELLTTRPEEIPAARSGHGMAYDAARGVTVMFGGEVGTGSARNPRLQNDTWEWDGLRWRQRGLEADAPPARRDGRLVYDEGRARVLLFGGRDIDNEPLGDTWLWDGVSWTKGPDGPPARFAHALAYDPRHGNVVLFGGAPAFLQTPFGDTWVWNGIEWQRAAEGPSGSRRSHHAIAFDVSAGGDGQGALLLFGGVHLEADKYQALADTWEWDGSSWRQLLGTPPPVSAQHTMFTGVDGRARVFGGADELLDFQDRNRELGAPNRGQVLIWEGDAAGGSWVTDVRGLPGSAPCRSTTTAHDCIFVDHASVFDSARGLVVTFGGRLNNETTKPQRPETWLLEGQSWREPASTAAAPDEVLENTRKSPELPVGRSGHALVAVRPNAIALFGGRFSEPEDADAAEDAATWLWDGTRWTRASIAGGPQARRQAAFLRREDGRALLFGGFDSYGMSVAEPWELSFAPPAQWSWSPRDLTACGVASANSPRASAAVSAPFSFGGATEESNVSADLLQWDGSCWQPMDTSAPPPAARSDAALAQLDSSLLLFSGQNGSDFLDGTWLHQPSGAGWINVTATAGRAPEARMGHSLIASSSGQSALLFGGSSSSSLVQALRDTWVFAQGTWTNVTDDREAPQPGPTTDHAMVLEPQTGRALLFGGLRRGQDEPNNQTWECSFPDRPAHTALFDLTDVEGTHRLALTRAAVRAIAGGDSLASGAELWVWQGDQWKLGRWNDAPSASPGPLDWDTTDARELLGLVAGQTLGVQLRPREPSGPTPAQLASDLVELTIEYSLDPDPEAQQASPP
jgi:hypothetical protein